MNIIQQTSLTICTITLILASLVSCQDDRFKQGKILYEFHCASCHMDDGSGLAELYPPLNQSDFLADNKKDLPHIIRYGIEGTLVVNGVEFDIPMSGIPELSAVEISNISNYVLSAWDNDLGTVDFDDVMKVLNPRD